MLKKVISMLAVAAIMISGFVGWGGSNSTAAQNPVKLTMTYWNPGRKDLMEKLNAKFMQENPGITVELSQIPGDQYEKVLKTRFLSDNGPDVYLMFGSKAYLYGKDGYFGDLTNEPYAKNVITAYKGSCTYQGKLYAIPWSAMGSGVFYNKKVFSSVGITNMPKTYNDFLAICEKIKKAGITPIARGAKDTWTGLHETGPLYADFVLGKNENFQIDRFNGKFKFVNSPEMKDYLGKYITLVDKGYIEKGVLGMNHSQAAQEVADGKAAMLMGISVFYGDIKLANKDADIGFFSLPDDKGNSYQVGASDEAIGYWPKGKNIEAAKKVVAFYSTPEIDKIYCDAVQALPCLTGVNANLDEPLKQCMKSIANSKIMFNFLDTPWPTAASDTYRSAIQAISAGKKDIKQILTDIDKAYDDNKTTISVPGVK